MATKFDSHQYAVEQLLNRKLAYEGGLIYAWQDTHWVPLDEDQGERQAYAWIVHRDRGFANPINARKAHGGLLDWAPALPPPASMDIIPCRNGYVHVKDNELLLKPADPALGLRHALSCDYLPDCGPPRQFERFLAHILPDAAVRTRVQEYVGYTLTADARFQRAQLWLGGGANGKGVLANIVQALHGQVAAVNLDALEGFRMSVMIGASLIYADEVPRRPINEQLLKSLIAGERVQVDRKYRNPLSIHVRGKWLVLGNHLPAITDHSVGFWRRWDIVPFTVTIPERERNPLLAEDIIGKELSGVLNWALKGLIRLKQRGLFDPILPEAMKAVIQTAKTETNSVLAWVEDGEIRLGSTMDVPKDRVFQHYRAWGERNGLAAMGSSKFWPRLKDILPYEESRKRLGGAFVRVCNVALPGWESAGLKPPETVPPEEGFNFGAR
ncbi:MAG: DNA primase [Pseudomonadota bacterium]|nr:DNA primase [Pseudomonadota bacterium]